MKIRDIETRAIHFSKKFGEKGSLNVPIYQNSTFQQKVPGKWEAYTYTRTNNPTEAALRATIAGLENANYGIAFSSGLAAINAVTELFATGDEIISTDDIYGGTHRLFSRFTEKKGIKFHYVDTTDLAAIKEKITEKTRLIYVETPSNPLLKITDLVALSKITKERGIMLAVDNTMATPYLQRPLDLGADLVIHSTSKYLSGHTNVVGGVVVTNDDQLYQELQFIHKAVGGNPGPFDCYLTMLGIKTLAVRMRQHQLNAQKVAEYLKTHHRVRRVYYPGHVDHPQHQIAISQMSGFGGIVSFELEGAEEQARTFLESLELFALTISFGSVTSLVNYPSVMSHKELNRDERIRRGFSDSLIRLSLGIEKDNDLIEDLDSAIAKTFK